MFKCLSGQTLTIIMGAMPTTVNMQDLKDIS
jgi:hypothetical protein